MIADAKKNPYLICPNGCRDVAFYQRGTIKSMKLFFEEDEDETKWQCGECGAVPITNTKKTVKKVIE